MDVPTWVWIATFAVTVVIFTFDLAVVGRRPHEPSMKECATYLSVYVGLALIFGLGVWYTSGGTFALEFYSGWLVEYSLSIDNLFIFIIIMSKFAVPRELQQYALMVGIVMALVMRAIFIFVGAAAINNFSWVFYLFGLFLIYTAVKLAKEGAEDEDDEFEENRLVEWVEKRFPATKEWHGRSIFTHEDGKRLITPLFIVIITLGTTDLLFALDSIPAIFGITKEPYLVLTANIFALMGLRQLYFLIGGLLQRLIYLSYGLAFLLAFIGVKLILHAMHENELPFINGGEHISWAPDIPIWLSLVVIVATLAVTAVVSLWASSRMSAAEQDASTGPRRDWEDG
ncbi:TerC family protein [Nocardioides sp. Soil805]|uniref:TerC family protein n=1 Tax=Nocardioides sp. Soil805 TaxID=1736416 RepID=UPI0007034A26|nr:TerC family protein [Nocardioides sp. Soil805]KRF35218.1 tellurium resistance protein TerC [Nocardioides sp. Soil805]